MQAKLKRKEYWVALKTSDRSVAVETACAAARAKREDMTEQFNALNGDIADQGVDEAERSIQPVPIPPRPHRSDNPEQPQALDTERPTEVKPGKYDWHTKAELIWLLEQQDHTKKLGLVWERGAKESPNNDLIAADVDVSSSS